MYSIIMTSIFVLTMFVTIVTTFKMIALLFDNSIRLPITRNLDMSDRFIMYPCAMFQIWFWFTYFGVLPL